MGAGLSAVVPNCFHFALLALAQYLDVTDPTTAPKSLQE